MKKNIRLLLCVIVLIGLIVSGVSASTSEPSKSAVTIEELNGKKIGVLTGSIHDTYAKKLFPDAELFYYTSVSDMVTAMLAGSIDAFSNDILSAYSLLAEHNEFAYIDEPLGYIETAFTCSKSGNGPALAGKISEFLAKLEADGTLSGLQEKWLSYGAGDYDVDMSGLSENGETIVFATSCSGKPNAYYYNNKPTGYEVELIAMFCREYGYNLDIQVTDFAGIIPGIVDGKYDVGADGIAVTEERAENVSFSEPDYNCPVVMITLHDGSADVPESFTKLSELDRPEVKLGTVTGMIVDQYYAEYFPKAQVLYYNTLTDLIFALQNGQVDGFIDDEPISKYLSARTEGLTYIDEPIGEPLGTAYVFGESPFALSAQAQFNEYLAEIKEDGTLDGIFELWYSTDDEKQVVSFPEEGENGTLRVCMYAESAPACYIKNEKPVGFEADILARFCEKYGYKAEISIIDFSGILNGVASGIYDMANGYISVTEERKASVNFSDIYYYSTPIMVVRDAASGSGQAKSGFFQSVRRSFERTFIVEARWKLIVQGILTTMEISVASAVLGTILGFGICMLKRTKSRIARTVVNVYVRLLQGMPLLVILMILYYVIFAKSGLNGVLVAIIAFALNFAAYACEIFGTGIDGVDIGQTEAALALGYTKSQAFFRVVMPQATLRFLPVYKGEFISLVKMTSIVGYIAVQDLTKMSDIIRSRTYEAFFPLIASAVIYFILSTLLMGVLVILEKKLEPKRNKKTLKGVVMK